MDDSVFQNTSINQPIKKSSKGKRFLFILIVLIILGGLAYTGKNLIGSKFQSFWQNLSGPNPKLWLPKLSAQLKKWAKTR